MQGGEATVARNSKDATLPASAAAGGSPTEQPVAPARRRRKGEAPKVSETDISVGERERRREERGFETSSRTTFFVVDSQCVDEKTSETPPPPPRPDLSLALPRPARLQGQTSRRTKPTRLFPTQNQTKPNQTNEKQKQDQRALNQAFSKHKAGLFSKAAELSRLSADARVFVFVGSAARGISWSYATKGKFSRRTIGRRRKKEEEGGGGAAAAAATAAAAASAPERPRPAKKSKTFYSNDTRTAESAVLQLLRGAASAADGGREYAPETAVVGEEEEEDESESEREEEEEEQEEGEAAAAKASTSSSSDPDSGSDSDSSDDDGSEDDSSSDDDDGSSSDGDSSEDSSSSEDEEEDGSDGGDAVPPPPLPRPSANEDLFSLEEGEELVPLPMEAALAPAPPPPASVAFLGPDRRRTARGRR